MFYIQEKNYDPKYSYLYTKRFKSTEIEQISFRHKKYLVSLRLARALIRKFNLFYKPNNNQTHNPENLVIKYDK